MTSDMTVGTLVSGNHVQVEVSNEGAGIAPVIINSIFNPNFSGR